MEYTQIVTVAELEKYARTRDSEAVIPELIWMLVTVSVSDLTTCRIPYGDAVNQTGCDGFVETKNGFREFVPKGRSYWEIGTGGNAPKKATKDFKARTRNLTLQERQNATFVFVTPHGAGGGGWNQTAQARWINKRQKFGWGEIKVLDGDQTGNWLREVPAIGKWLLKRMGTVKSTTAISTPREHWENLLELSRPNNDPPLPQKLFLVGREQACTEILRLFRGEAKQLTLAVESANDAQDFVAAYLASLDEVSRRSFSNKCLFIKEPQAWESMANLLISHVLVAHPELDLEDAGEQLHMIATKKGHAVVIPISGAGAGRNAKFIPLRSPSASMIETVLRESGYKHDRAQELAGAGTLNLGALKRHLRGLGGLPPYATWDNARELARAGLIGKWSGENPADKSVMETLLGKTYGEWIETVRPDTLRLDTPLTQRNENWKIISRAEAWAALGPLISNDDLDRFQEVAVAVLGERDPKFDLPPEEHFSASVYGKVPKHSRSIRKGIAESLALLGSRPQSLSSCSDGKPEFVAARTVRLLLEEADWIMWASLDHLLPLLAEAAPNEFLQIVEAALLFPAKSPFNHVFAQEGSGITGRNYMSGLLWALETLAWHPDYLQRVTIVLGELAAIDPGGNWANRPANSIVDIFLPWHPQTCAPMAKRNAAVKALLKEQPAVGWKLLMSLLPNMHSASSGCRKPAWRQFIPVNWSDAVTDQEYWNQVAAYADILVENAKADLGKLAELINQLPNLPNPAHSRVLEHFRSESVLAIPEAKRLTVWEALIDLSRKHRKFPDAQWAMPSEAILSIEEAAAKLTPKSPTLLHRRLFSDRDFDLFDEAGNYEEQRQKLDLRRQVAVAEILDYNYLAGLLDFARQVANPGTVGHALGRLDRESADTDLLPLYLNSDEKVVINFVANFVWGRFQKRGWQWVDTVMAKNWTMEQNATFFTFLPFGYETWRRAEARLGESAAVYWKKVNVQLYGPQPYLVEAVEKLLRCQRPNQALACINRLVHEKAVFSPTLAIQALEDSLAAQTPPMYLDQHAIGEIIKWLQDNPATDSNALFKIEWAYLPLLDHTYGGAPKTLETRLAADPNFFCEVLALVFRSDKDEVKNEASEAEQKIAQNAYRLLDGWRSVPGTSPNGVFDGETFINWLNVVSQRTKESGYHRIALNQIGQVLPYSPPDPDGLWIHHSVAEVLNAKEAGEMRSGFNCEKINSRGVHLATGGKAELELAAHYRKRADDLETNGYHRFATAIRELAEDYELEAKRDSKSDPFDD